MRLWNPSHFTIGKPGRSNCPRWRGQDFQFEPNESKDVTDACGRWLITAFGYYGLVSLPDRNIVTDPKEYDKVVDKLRVHGIQQLYKWSVRVVDQYREEAKKHIDERVRPPKVNEFVKLASKICKHYQAEILLTDPETIEDHKLMREILGNVEHDSDKALDQVLNKSIADDDKNAAQYSREQPKVEISKPNKPKKPKHGPYKNTGKGSKFADTNSVVPPTMDNMKSSPDLDNSAMG